MKRTAPFLVGGLLISLVASPSAAVNLTWNLANPSQVAAYQVGKGVITVASAPQYACGNTELVPEATPFVYDYKVGTWKGVLCSASYVAPIAAYYQVGSPTTVTLNTKAGAVTVRVRLAPPTLAPPPVGHLPFH